MPWGKNILGSFSLGYVATDSRADEVSLFSPFLPTLETCLGCPDSGQLCDCCGPPSLKHVFLGHACESVAGTSSAVPLPEKTSPAIRGAGHSHPSLAAHSHLPEWEYVYLRIRLHGMGGPSSALRQPGAMVCSAEVEINTL